MFNELFSKMSQIIEGKVTIRKYNGDDEYSWAVFKAGQSSPVVAGLSKREAQYHKTKIEQLANKDTDAKESKVNEDDIPSKIPPPKWVTEVDVWDKAIDKLRGMGTLMKDGKVNYGAAGAIYKAKLRKAENV